MEPKATPLLAIVDDEVESARTLAHMLETFGWVCDLHASAASLMRALPQERYRAVFLDLSMPEMDGIELIEHLASKGWQVPLILISGHSSSVLVAAQTIAVQSGVPILGRLEKPVRLQDIALINQEFFDATVPQKDRP